MVEFNERDLSLITLALPADCDPHRLELLPRILAEWGRTDLPEHLKLEPPSESASRNSRLATVAKKAEALVKALEALTPFDQSFIASELGGNLKEPKRRPFSKAAFQQNLSNVAGMSAAIKELSRGASGAIIKNSRGQPRNIRSHLVLRDIVAIYEYLSGRKASRIITEGETDGEKAHDIGPFWKFSFAIWPVVFGNAEYGLSSAIKVWSENPYRPAESSALLANIDMRHPEWGIFKR